MRKKNDIQGVLILDKPKGVSSNNILQRIRYIYGATKAGHTGALDPLATGMLPICFGETSKFTGILLESDKGYRVVAHLGIRTNTSDREGEIVEEKEVTCNYHDIQKVIINNFIGRIKQQPTIWSALKYEGKPLYEYARANQFDVPRPTREVRIFDVRIVEWNSPYLTLDIICSKGTYIRTLVDNIGQMLGCGAHVADLRRTFISDFRNYPMVSADEVEELFAKQDHEGLAKLLLPIDTPVKNMPELKLTDLQTLKICQGMTIEVPEIKADKKVRIYSDTEGFLGIGFGQADGLLRGYRLVSNTIEIVRKLKTESQDPELIKHIRESSLKSRQPANANKTKTAGRNPNGGHQNKRKSGSKQRQNIKENRAFEGIKSPKIDKAQSDKNYKNMVDPAKAK